MTLLTKTAKCVLIALSSLFMLMAIGLIFVGSWVYVSYGDISPKEILQSHFILFPSLIIILVGIFLFILGIIGCVAICKEHKCLLGCYFSVILIIFVGLVCGAILAYIYRGKIGSSVRDGFSDCMNKYQNDTSCTSEVDFVQQKLKCCGSDNYTDWMNVPWHKQHGNETVRYPESCCEDKECYYNTNHTSLYTQGCVDKLKNEFKRNLGVIAGVGAAFAIIQVVGLLFTCVLICVKKNEVPYIGLNEPAGGMRV